MIAAARRTRPTRPQPPRVPRYVAVGLAGFFAIVPALACGRNAQIVSNEKDAASGDSLLGAAAPPSIRDAAA
jgi:hypothetical protein